MAKIPAVHKKVHLGTDHNGDRYRDATIMGDPDDGEDPISLWIDSHGFGVHVTFTRQQAHDVAAALLEASGIPLGPAGYGATGTASLGEIAPDAT